jgi:uncharacterized protein
VTAPEHDDSRPGSGPGSEPEVAARPVPALDARVAELRSEPGRTWGVRDAVLGVLVVPAAMVVVLLLVVLAPGLPGVLVTGLATVVLAAAGVLVARRAARQSGGFERALGLDLPEWSDSGRILGWSLLLLLVQAGVLALVSAVFPALQGVAPDNTSVLRDQPLPALLVFAVLAVAVAPVLEELLFRGLVLRGLMMRIGFWPAAVVSSVLFGLFHAQGPDLTSVALVIATGVFGLGLCVLTRRTGRLGPAIGVHALRNAAAVAAVALA